jgi:hypothetical protein
LSCSGHLGNTLPSSYVSGVEAQTIYPLFKGFEGQAMVKMDVGNQRNADLFFYFPEVFRGVSIWNSNPDNLATLPLSKVDLGHSGGYISRIGLGHRLDSNRCSAPYGNRTDKQLPAFSAGDRVRGSQAFIHRFLI